MTADSNGFKKAQATKHDQEKIRVELLSPIWLFGVGRVLTFGAQKYAAHNWRKGLELSRVLGACLRHVLAFLGGEDRDPESGLPHLDHAGCCLMFARELWETRPDLDDRYKQPKPPEVVPHEVSEKATEPAPIISICAVCEAKFWGCAPPADSTHGRGDGPASAHVGASHDAKGDRPECPEALEKRDDCWPADIHRPTPADFLFPTEKGSAGVEQAAQRGPAPTGVSG